MNKITADTEILYRSKAKKIPTEMEKAKEELRKYNTKICELHSSIGKIYEVTEYVLQENEYDEDGEVEEYGDIWEESIINIDVVDEKYDTIKSFNSYRDAEEFIMNDNRELCMSF